MAGGSSLSLLFTVGPRLTQSRCRCRVRRDRLPYVVVAAAAAPIGAEEQDLPVGGDRRKALLSRRGQRSSDSDRVQPRRRRSRPRSPDRAISVWGRGGRRATSCHSGSGQGPISSQLVLTRARYSGPDRTWCPHVGRTHRCRLLHAIGTILGGEVQELAVVAHGRRQFGDRRADVPPEIDRHVQLPSPFCLVIQRS